MLITNGFAVIWKMLVNKITENIFFEVKDWCHKEGIEFYYSGELFDTYSGESNIKYTL